MRTLNYAPSPDSRLPVFRPPTRATAPALNPYANLRIDPGTYNLQPVQQEPEEPGWGSALGALGANLGNYFLSRRNSQGLPEHVAASHTDEPIITPHTGGASMDGHEMGFAHGGFVMPEMVGQTIKFAELEPEVAIDERGNVQLLDQQGEGTVNRPAAIIPLSKFQAAMQQSGQPSPFAATASQPAEYPKFSMPAYTGPRFQPPATESATQPDSGSLSEGQPQVNQFAAPAVRTGLEPKSGYGAPAGLGYKGPKFDVSLASQEDRSQTPPAPSQLAVGVPVTKARVTKARVTNRLTRARFHRSRDRMPSAPHPVSLLTLNLRPRKLQLSLLSRNHRPPANAALNSNRH
jgi:hypothetical protein